LRTSAAALRREHDGPARPASAGPSSDSGGAAAGDSTDAPPTGTGVHRLAPDEAVPPPLITDDAGSAGGPSTPGTVAGRSATHTAVGRSNRRTAPGRPVTDPAVDKSGTGTAARRPGGGRQDVGGDRPVGTDAAGGAGRRRCVGITRATAAEPEDSEAGATRGLAGQ